MVCGEEEEEVIEGVPCSQRALPLNEITQKVITNFYIFFCKFNKKKLQKVKLKLKNKKNKILKIAIFTKYRK